MILQLQDITSWILNLKLLSLTPSPLYLFSRVGVIKYYAVFTVKNEPIWINQLVSQNTIGVNHDFHCKQVMRF